MLTVTGRIDLGKGRIDGRLAHPLALEHEGDLDAAPAVEVKLVAAVGSGIALLVEKVLVLQALDDLCSTGRGETPGQQLGPHIALGLLAAGTQGGGSRECSLGTEWFLHLHCSVCVCAIVAQSYTKISRLLSQRDVTAGVRLPR